MADVLEAVNGGEAASNHRKLPRARAHDLCARFSTMGDGRLSHADLRGLLAYLDRGHHVQHELHRAWERVGNLEELCDDLKRQLAAANTALAASHHSSVPSGLLVSSGGPDFGDWHSSEDVTRLLREAREEATLVARTEAVAAERAEAERSSNPPRDDDR